MEDSTKCPNDRSAGMSQSVFRPATDLTVRVGFPLEARDFSSYHRVRTESGVHLAGRGVMLSTHLQLVPRSEMVELYLHYPIRLHGVVFC
jgi:hypothetical protein